MKDSKISYLELFYGADAKRWENYTDDRKLFSNSYYQIIEALEELKGIDNAYVRVAMNRAIKEDEKRLASIQRYFIDK